MKTPSHFLAMVFALITLCATAQTTSIPYQAVARDSFNTPLPERSISLRFSIREGSSGGTVLYKETDTVTTSKLGLFTSYIGEGHPVTGTFASINWGSGAKYLQVEADAAGGTSYVDLGATQLKSVPFSLRAVKSDDVSAIPSKRVPYATGSGLSSDANFTRDSAGGNTQIKVVKGANYYALNLGDSTNFNIGGTTVNLPTSALSYGDTAGSYSMSIGVGKVPLFSMNQYGYLNLSSAAGHYANLAFLENAGKPLITANANIGGAFFDRGSTMQLRSNQVSLMWHDDEDNKHGIEADSLSLRLYSSTTDYSWLWPNTDGASGQPLVTNGVGDLTFAALGGNATAMGQHVLDAGNSLASDTIAITTNKNNIYNPSGTVTSLLIQLPTTTNDGDVFILTFESAVTTITYVNGTVGNGALTTATSSSQKIYTYNAATGKWY